MCYFINKSVQAARPHNENFSAWRAQINPTIDLSPLRTPSHVGCTWRAACLCRSTSNYMHSGVCKLRFALCFHVRKSCRSRFTQVRPRPRRRWRRSFRLFLSFLELISLIKSHHINCLVNNFRFSIMLCFLAHGYDQQSENKVRTK